MLDWATSLPRSSTPARCSTCSKSSERSTRRRRSTTPSGFCGPRFVTRPETVGWNGASNFLARPTNNARQGFLDHSDYLAILEELPGWARDPFRFAYYSGWRKNEVLSLRWDEVSFESGVVRLDAARSKTRETRTLPFIGEIAEVLARRQADRINGASWVFHRDGRRISGSSFRNHFREASVMAGRPGLIVHDCRRTAYRNLLRAGVIDKVAREMVGWRSRVMPDRYNIVDERDLEDAAEKLREFLDRKKK